MPTLDSGRCPEWWADRPRLLDCPVSGRCPLTLAVTVLTRPGQLRRLQVGWGERSGGLLPLAVKGALPVLGRAGLVGSLPTPPRARHGPQPCWPGSCQRALSMRPAGGWSLQQGRRSSEEARPGRLPSWQSQACGQRDRVWTWLGLSVVLGLSTLFVPWEREGWLLAGVLGLPASPACPRGSEYVLLTPSSRSGGGQMLCLGYGTRTRWRPRLTSPCP